MNTPTPRIQVAAFLLVMTIVPVFGQAATVSYSGSVTYPYTGFEALGTFKPGFNPHSIIAVYGDPYGNLFSFYTRIVTDGNFRPLNSGVWSGQTFSGAADTTNVAGQPLWLLLFNAPNPDNGYMSVVCSGTDLSWLAPQGADNTTLDGNSANVFVLGSGGHGAPLSLDIQPFPEPSSGIVLLLLGATSLLRRRTHDPQGIL